MAHSKKVCKHGVVESRCRCRGPHDIITVPCATDNHGVLLHGVCKGQTELSDADLWR